MGKSKTVYPFLFAAVLVLPTVLVGCSSDSGIHDLQQFVTEVRARPAGRIAAVPEFKTYESRKYTAVELRDPFAPVEALQMQAAPGDGPRPDMERNKEPLEQFPLDTLKFAGHMEQEGRTWAIVTAPDGLVHRVQMGNYLGQNYGRVIDIREGEIAVLEMITDGLGGWMERAASLTLQGN